MIMKMITQTVAISGAAPKVSGRVGSWFLHLIQVFRRHYQAAGAALKDQPSMYRSDVLLVQNN